MATVEKVVRSISLAKDMIVSWKCNKMISLIIMLKTQEVLLSGMTLSLSKSHKTTLKTTLPIFMEITMHHSLKRLPAFQRPCTSISSLDFLRGYYKQMNQAQPQVLKNHQKIHEVEVALIHSMLPYLISTIRLQETRTQIKQQ